MGTDKPLVTVLMLSYNSPDLYCAIKSVLSQSYGNIQLVIVDDHSMEFDRNSIAEFIMRNNKGNVSFEIAENKENLGIIRSSNLALSISKGEYVINLAGDDCFYDNEVVADIAAEFQRTMAQVLTGRRQRFSDNMTKPLSIEPAPGEINLINRTSPDRLFEKMTGKNLIFGCCTAHSMRCFEEYGVYDEKYRLLDDYSMNMALLRKGVKFHAMNRIFIKYRDNGISDAENINEAYLNEADLLFESDILPFSKAPAKAIKKYAKWKNATFLSARYHSALKKAGNNKIKRFAVKAIHYLCHPIVFVEAFKNKIIITR